MWPVTLAAPLMGLMWVTQAETRSSAIAKRAQADQAFVHPGALHTSKDFARIKRHLEAGEEPWATAWQHLQSNDLAQTSWEPSSHELLVRGEIDGHDQTFEDAYRDAHSAYQLAVRWQLSGDDTYAEHAASILDAWSSTLKDITGNPDMYLAAGLYGYQFANAAELLREYGGWSDERQHIFADMLVNIFAHYNRLFLDEHNGQPDFYYANWDLCNIASLMAIGIYADNATLFDFALEYFLHGPADGAVANGALPFFGIANFTEENTGKTLTQNQEAGRDQAHALMCFGLLATIAQQGYNQGVDLYEAWGDQILNAAEYAAKYNVNETVPYQPYESWEGVLGEISPDARSDVRPGFETIYAHYSGIRGLDASWTMAYRDYVNSNLEDNVKGGGGDYSPRSGGFDYLGHGTLLYRL